MEKKKSLSKQTPQSYQKSVRKQFKIENASFHPLIFLAAAQKVKSCLLSLMENHHSLSP